MSSFNFRGGYVQASVELGTEDVERCPHFRGCCVIDIVHRTVLETNHMSALRSTQIGGGRPAVRVAMLSRKHGPYLHALWIQRNST